MVEQMKATGASYWACRACDIYEAGMNHRLREVQEQAKKAMALANLLPVRGARGAWRPTVGRGAAAQKGGAGVRGGAGQRGGAAAEKRKRSAEEQGRKRGRPPGRTRVGAMSQHLSSEEEEGLEEVSSQPRGDNQELLSSQQPEQPQAGAGRAGGRGGRRRRGARGGSGLERNSSIRRTVHQSFDFIPQRAKHC
jgi:hypothetical protein